MRKESTEVNSFSRQELHSLSKKAFAAANIVILAILTIQLSANSLQFEETLISQFAIMFLVESK